jgi:hypothetical protein
VSVSVTVFLLLLLHVQPTRSSTKCKAAQCTSTLAVLVRTVGSLLAAAVVRGFRAHFVRVVRLAAILSEMNKVEIWHGSRMVEFSYNVNDTAS